MIQNSTRCRVIDNSGALIAEVFGKYKQPINKNARVLATRNDRYSVTGDIVKVTCKKVEPNKNIKKGTVSKAIIAKTTKKEHKKCDGCHVKYFVNAVVLLDNGSKKRNRKNYELKPIGTSVKTYVSSKVSIKEIINMSKGSI